MLAALAHPGHIVIYAPGDSLPYRRDDLEIHRVYALILMPLTHHLLFLFFKCRKRNIELLK
ncbi:hypothetical protein CKY12_02860 [Photorhabdus sp. S12-55]|nr:hypothetical protein PluDJC_19390 [Photorhabdus laumondii subsp. laumondii]RAW76032.1 hypothetical protein CKY15_01335 [Photorhabdus sp. S7-51]RAW76523.1 hypothetical protein CKY14_01780 [Photorhabdus sp. S14-60]RAW80528.1 hypothetical protein CKY06_01790 [Photorhabdus sp. S15-56]RAW88931.1 hypothetical protein CKY09_03250 [Photorhabdus sp. S5P8-50]RAW89208.1 hypothetical protein CKY12_02860 [Photorhabdus sp. S12-55]